VRPFKVIFCHDLSEFESYMPSQAVRSLSASGMKGSQSNVANDRPHVGIGMLRDFPMFGTSGELAAEVERSVAACLSLEVTQFSNAQFFALIGSHIPGPAGYRSR
jgi:hypothetical protein